MSYTTRNEAIAREIAAPIDAGDTSADYDLDGIANEVLGYDPHDGYYVHVTPEEFWEAVERHAK
jgi:hypothetical protein